MRQTVQQLVGDIEPFDRVEADHRADVLAWLASDAEIFRTAKPATPPKHLVSYCLLVDMETEHALLVDHRDAQRWLPTGGHVEPDENPVCAARREIDEELCIAPEFLRDVGEVPLLVTVNKSGGLSESHIDVSLWFVFEGSVSDEITPDEGEFVGARWWAFDDIRHGAGIGFDPHLPRFIAKLRARPNVT